VTVPGYFFIASCKTCAL